MFMCTLFSCIIQCFYILQVLQQVFPSIPLLISSSAELSLVYSTGSNFELAVHFLVYVWTCNLYLVSFVA